MFGEPLINAYPKITQTLPPSSLGYDTNNLYPQFPPLMNDGRAITASWQPEAVANERIIQIQGIKTNYEYRQYLTQNANSVMKTDYTEACNDAGYYARYVDLPSQGGSGLATSSVMSQPVSIPYSFTSFGDKTQPYGYSNSDLKDLYLSREQLQARMVAPTITQDQILKANSAN